MKEQHTLYAVATDYLNARGISSEAARSRGLYSGTLYHGTPTLEIPFYDVKGKPLQDAGRAYGVTRPFAEHKHKKDTLPSAKFLTPKGSTNHLYLDPQKDWAKIFADPSQRLLFTEGPVKAISAHEHDITPVVALMGVWNWRTKTDGKDSKSKPLPELDKIEWTDREVLIVFDSDITENHNVRQAADRLAAELSSRGAHVSLVLIPPNETGDKQGLDDFCVAHGKNAATAFEKLERDEYVPDSRPIVAMRDGQLDKVVDQAEEICATYSNLYTRGNTLVRVVKALETGERVRQDDSDAERRYLDPAQPVIQEYSIASLQLACSRVARWQKFNKVERWIDADPQAKYVNGLLALGEWPNIRALNGFSAVPILRPDGSVHQTPGYDPETRLLLIGNAWPQIPEKLSYAMAEVALANLDEPFALFPFVDDMHRSVVFAAILAGVARHLLPCVPYTHLDAPRQGSGKTALAEAIGIIIMGTVPATHSFPTDEAETRKKLTSCLLRGDRVILLDNAHDACTINNAILAACITSSIWGDRRLGYTEVLNLPQNAVIIGTGNNNRIAGDLPRRTLKCRIDPDCERPEQRKFAFVPQHFCRANRPALVAAALTVLSAYIQAGRPKPKDFPEMGGFKEFDLVRGSLVWLGLPDPLATQNELFQEDDQAEDAAVFEAIWKAEGDKVSFTVASLMVKADEQKDLYAALLKIRSDPELALERAVGYFFRDNRDRIMHGLKLRRVNTGNPARWAIQKQVPK